MLIQLYGGIVMKFNLILTIIFVTLFSACSGIKPQQSEKEKLDKVNDGEWKANHFLKALCLTGEVSCSEGAEVVCYSDPGLTPISSEEETKKLSVPACWKDGKVLDSEPVCYGDETPVCGNPDVYHPEKGVGVFEGDKAAAEPVETEAAAEPVETEAAAEPARN